MKHSHHLAVWISLGSVFFGLLSICIILLVNQRKKAADTPPQPGPGTEGTGQAE